MQERFDAIVLAGYDPDRPHAFTATHSQPYKVLIPAGGKPMLARVLAALRSTPIIARCVVVGFEHSPLDAGFGDAAGDASGSTAGGNDDTAVQESVLSAQPVGEQGEQAAKQIGEQEIEPDVHYQDVHYIANQGSIYANLMAAFRFLGERQPHDRHVFLISADVPLVTAQHVEWFIRACAPLDKDLYMAVVEKEVMEQTFPQSTRTYVPLREGRFCNGELFLARISSALNRQAIYQDIINRRKSTLRQVQLLGPGLLLKFLFRRLSMDDVVAFVRNRIRIEAAAVPLPFAETGMDVDRPAQLTLVDAYLTQHPERH